jgi:hypothetical protein
MLFLIIDNNLSHMINTVKITKPPGQVNTLRINKTKNKSRISSFIERKHQPYLIGAFHKYILTVSTSYGKTHKPPK